METVEHQNDEAPAKPKGVGGLITMPFIIANEAFEKVASYGLLPNMIFYLMNDYKMEVSRATTLLFFWSAATNFLPLLGAFVADSYLGRFRTIGSGSIASFLGMLLLWLTAMIPGSRPPPCDQMTQSCRSATPAQYALLVASFGLMSVGAGGIRPCSLAFGADQLYKNDCRNNESVLESYFGWYYASAAVSVLIALTGIVYIQVHLGWKVGYGVPAILMFCASLLFFVASPLYIKMKASKSLLTRFLQVIVVTYKNRRVAFPPHGSNGYHHDKCSTFTTPTKKLRFLNKACIITNHEDVTPTGVFANPWDLCTVQQVDELKALVKVIPIWSTGIMIAINLAQTTFPTLQASSMDRHISSRFEIPAGSYGMFTIIALAFWIVVYDRAIIPLASKIAGKRVYLGVKLRMGVGIALSCLSMVVSGLVEHVRRKKAIEQRLADAPNGLVNMSAMWLVPQNILAGLAEAFNAIAQTEFYYSEFPKNMSSIAASLFGVGMAVANLLATVILKAVNDVSGSGGRESWVSSNINKGHYDYYYWILALLTFVNLIYFVLCSWAYGPCADIVGNSRNEGIVSGLPEEKLCIEERPT